MKMNILNTTMTLALVLSVSFASAQSRQANAPAFNRHVTKQNFDRREDKWDRHENYRDRKEDVRDRKEDVRDHREDKWDRRENKRDRRS